MAAKGGRSSGSKLELQIGTRNLETNLFRVFYVELSDGFDFQKILESLRIRNLNYFAVVPIFLVCPM